MTKPATSEPAQYCFDFPRPNIVTPRRNFRRPDNLYFGLKPRSAEAKVIADGALSWSDMLSQNSVQTGPKCLHVSLVSCGPQNSPPELLIARLHDLMNGFGGQPVDILFDRLGPFGGNAIVLYSNIINHAFEALRRSVLARTATLSCVRWTNGKTATRHMTIFRGKLRGPPRRVEPVAWRAAQVLLIYSHNGAKLHTIVGQWPLTAGKSDMKPMQASANRRRDLFD